MNIKTRTWQIVEVAKSGDRLSWAFDIFILILIFLNIIAVIAGTVESVETRFGRALWIFECLSVAVFTLEYLARLWSCTTDSRFDGAITGRLKLAAQPLLIVDLIAILPFYLPFLGLDLRFVRVLRMLRIIRVAKISRYYSSLKTCSGKRKKNWYLRVHSWRCC
jgi:voltage-gated potassium channel